MIKELVKIATRLDAAGLTSEADQIDRIIRKIAGNMDDYYKRVEEIDSTESYGGKRSPMGEHRPYHHELVGKKPRRPSIPEDFSEYLDSLNNEEASSLLGEDFEKFNPERHGESYEMDTDSMESRMDSDRGYGPSLEKDSSFRRSSLDKRGMRKRS
jgi:hypothetical protein